MRPQCRPLRLGSANAKNLGIFRNAFQLLRSEAFESQRGAGRKVTNGATGSHFVGPAIALIRAPTCTAMPLHSSPRFSHSPDVHPRAYPEAYRRQSRY